MQSEPKCEFGESRFAMMVSRAGNSASRGLFENVEIKMKEATARRLVVGSRVTWDKNPKDVGTVIEVGFNACKVRWDDPRNGEVSLLYFTAMANIGSFARNGRESLSLADI
jgi:hypothetical protein